MNVFIKCTIAPNCTVAQVPKDNNVARIEASQCMLEPDLQMVGISDRSK